MIWRRSMGLDDPRPWRSVELEMVCAKRSQDGGQTGHAEGVLLARTPMTGTSSCPCHRDTAAADWMQQS